MVQERVMSVNAPGKHDDFVLHGTSEVHSLAVEQAIHIMRTHLSEALSLMDLADHVYLSPYHFNRIFHRVVGIPPIEFLATLRLEAAKRLLLTTDLSVIDVCFAVGYSSPGSFTTRFTQSIGLSPRNLRLKSQALLPPALPSLTEIRPPAVGNVVSVRGELFAPYPFYGHIFVGLFPRPIPQGRPIRCTRLNTPGPFQLTHVPAGRYYVMVAAYPQTINPRVMLVPGNTSLVGMEGPVFIAPENVPEPLHVKLRTHRPTDPPILTALSYNESR